MSKYTPKFYVVWEGSQTGVFSSWDECQKQVQGYTGAKYKSFPSRAEADAAYNIGYETYYKLNPATKKTSSETNSNSSGTKPILDSIAVDGAWNTASGDAEYQGVYTKTGELLFRQGPFADGTNNIVEFLGLVHGLAYLKERNSNLPIYSDSKTALAWLRNKKCKTTMELNARNKPLFDLIARAEKWLADNTFTNPVLKWETEDWGENPADFGRK